VPERPLTDRELRIVRAMIDEHEQRLAVDRWFRLRWRGIVKGLGVLSAVVITIAAVEEIVRSLVGG
jgi:hypothetical protein